jgi:hypothetical protein
MGKFKRKAHKRKARQTTSERPKQGKGSGESLKEFIDRQNLELYKKGQLTMDGIVAAMGGIPNPYEEFTLKDCMDDLTQIGESFGLTKIPKKSLKEFIDEWNLQLLREGKLIKNGILQEPEILVKVVMRE